MLSMQYIRDNAADVRAMLARRHVEAPLDEILALDVEHRRLLRESEELKAERNAASKRIGATKDPEERGRLIAEQQGAREQIDRLDEAAKGAGERLRSLLLQVPNVVLPEVPEGPDESGNVVTRQHGALPVFDFAPKPHWELGEQLGIIDFEAGVKMSGSRFYVLEGLGARLQWALIQYMLDLHIHEHGLHPIYPPFMVKEECFWATGDLPKFQDNIYRDAEDDLWMVTTAEVPLTNLWREEIIPPGRLPLRYVAYTACFRREKMSAGRDVRGMKRGHQFDKVEMFTYCEPERSADELAAMLERAEAVCRGLGLTYRIVQLCTGDLGFKAGVTYDIETWAPGQQEWLEVSSVSNVLDFQARRANIRFRREAGGRTEFPHMLNGSGLALPRVVISVLETYQQADGSVVVPEALRGYLRTDVIR
ncbi:MAG: serine--tRNA ligase [Dehalococcoidia bacterium]